MQDIIQYKGKLWRRIIRNDWENLPGKNILFKTAVGVKGFHKVASLSFGSRGLGVTFTYAGRTSWDSLEGGTDLDNTHGWYYIEVPKDSNKCYCCGPTFNKFCFDTQRVEPVCARCRRRK